ncbi:MAG TPA: response regulator [Chitinivibrionales bacterium]|nr:response regulator [Chitinivibrionales bacterium]
MTGIEPKNACILVVDDEKEMREMIADYLDGEGYAVLTAENGREALDKCLRQHHVDLVLSDINMPVMRGFELLKEVREKYPSVKRVLITAYNVEDYLELALKHDVGNIFVKSTPFNFSELSQILENLLTGDIFGLSKYFDRPVLEKTFEIKKGNKLDAYASEIMRHVPDTARAKKVELVLIELLANAVFYGVRREKGDNKDEWNYDFELTDAEVIFVTLLADAEKYGISVLDKGGRLKKSDVLYWINRQTTRDEAGVPVGIYDTHGRGFYIAREYIDRLIVNIDANKRTEVNIINYYSKTYHGYKPLHINEI